MSPPGRAKGAFRNGRHEADPASDRASGGPRPPASFPASLAHLSSSTGHRAQVLRPQRPLQHAAESAAAQQVPSGLGLDSAQVRLRLVERLRAQGLRDEAVARAICSVPRHLFVDSALVTHAYEDTSLPIGLGQTISKPSVVARMIELLMAGEGARQRGTLGRVLEIGSGCGYQAAVLAQLSTRVVSVERLRGLFDRAQATLSGLRETRVRLVYGDGRLGHPPNAPYDSIIAAAGGEAVPAAWTEQLAVGGRLVAPVQGATGKSQLLCIIDRTERGCVRTLHEAVMFVALKSGTE